METSIEHLHPLETKISDLQEEHVSHVPVTEKKEVIIKSDDLNESSLLQKHSTIIQVAIASLAGNYIPSDTLLSIPGVSKIISTLGESPIRSLLVVLLFLLFQFFM